jgi:hypothetical protein
MQTLWDVMDHYNKGDGITNPWLDKDMQPLALQTGFHMSGLGPFADISGRYRDGRVCYGFSDACR